MTERRPCTETLEDALDNNNGACKSLKAELSPKASGGTNYDATLGFEDPLGRLRFGKTNLAGEIIVDSEGSEISCLDDEGTQVGGSVSEVVIATITLQQDLLYREFEAWVSCFRDTKWKLVAIADAGVTDVETVIAHGRCGSNNYNSSFFQKCRKYIAGSVGVQLLELRAFNLNVPSDIDATIACEEDQTP